MTTAYSSIFGGPVQLPYLHPSQSSAAAAPRDWSSTSKSPSAEPASATSEPEAADTTDADDEAYNLSDPALPDRPNRFRGSASKWRQLTQAERDLAESLDRLEDEDLAIHLYNAHSLKRRLYADVVSHVNDEGEDAVPRKRRRIEQWKGKEQWMNAGNEDGEAAWYPSRQWTAWPMEPLVVPRPDERLEKSWYGDSEEEKWTVKMSDDRKALPSSEMEEALMAEVLRTARGTFESRPWARPEPPRGTNHRQERKRASSSKPFSGTVKLHSRKRPRSSSGDTYAKSESGLQRGRGQPQVNETMESDNYLHPVVLADDDQARDLLQPSIRHILSKVDDLLLGLHHSRQNHFDEYESDSSTDSRTSRGSSTAQSGTKSGRKPIPRGRRPGATSPGRKRSRSDAAKYKALRRIRPRDWSEVLGLAAMTGWAGDVVKRAEARCSRLFGESMRFTTMDTGPLEDQDGEEDKEGHETDSMDEMYGGVHVGGFMKPIKKRMGRRRKGGAVSDAESRAASEVSSSSQDSSDASND